MARKLLVSNRLGLLGLVLFSNVAFSLAFSRVSYGQATDSPVVSEQSVTDSQDASRTSSLFNSTTLPRIFRLPELPSPRLPSLPGFSLLRESASNSYAMTKRTSRRVWNRTKEMLRPFDPIDSASEDASYPPVSTTNRSSWLWWKSSEPEERKIETVNDFLSQERPKL